MIATFLAALPGNVYARDANLRQASCVSRALGLFGRSTVDAGLRTRASVAADLQMLPAYFDRYIDGLIDATEKLFTSNFLRSDRAARLPTLLDYKPDGVTSDRQIIESYLLRNLEGIRMVSDLTQIPVEQIIKLHITAANQKLSIFLQHDTLSLTKNLADKLQIPMRDAATAMLLSGPETIKDLSREGLETAEALGIPASRFVVDYARSASKIPLSEIRELAKPIRIGSELMGMDAMEFLGRLASLDIKVRDMLLRSGFDVAGTETPWSSFRHRLAWQLQDRRVYNPEVKKNIALYFSVDMFYSLTTEAMRSFYKDPDWGQAAVNIGIFALCDLVLGVKSASRASQRMAQRAPLMERALIRAEIAFGSLAQKVMPAAGFDLVVKYGKPVWIQHGRQLGRNGLFLAPAGFALAFIGSVTVRSMQELNDDEQGYDLNDVLMKSLWDAALVGTWLGVSANPRYYFLVDQLPRYLAKGQLIKDKRAQDITKIAFGQTNSFLGALGYTHLWQIPMSRWAGMDEGGEIDQGSDTDAPTPSAPGTSPQFAPNLISEDALMGSLPNEIDMASVFNAFEADVHRVAPLTEDHGVIGSEPPATKIWGNGPPPKELFPTPQDVPRIPGLDHLIDWDATLKSLEPRS